MFEGEKMAVDKALSTYGVKESSSLDFIVEASEESIMKQLTDLLRHRDLTCDELGLLYCYKHGVSINQALKTIGIDAKLQDFVKGQKTLVLEGNKVSLVRGDTTLQPLSVATQLEELLKENGPTMDITALCSKFVQKFHVSVANIVQMRPAEFLQQEKDTFAVLGNGCVTLKEFEAAEKAKVNARGARSRSPAVRWPAQQTSTVDRSRARSNEKSRQSPARSRPVALTQQKATDDTMYQDLHTKISSRSFNSRAAQLLSQVSEVVQEKTFLNVTEIVKGGSVGKGTAIEDCNDAVLVVFVKGLPSS